MKRVGKIGIIILLLSSFAYINTAMGNTKTFAGGIGPITEIFKETGADILEVNVTSTLEIPYTIWNRNEILDIKRDLQDQLGLTNKEEVLVNDNLLLYENEIMEDDSDKIFVHEFADLDTNQIVVTNTDKTGDVIGFKVYSANIQGEKTSYIIIDIIQNKRYKGIVERCNQSKEILDKYGSHIETNVNFVGVYEGKLSSFAAMKKIEDLVSSIRGKVVEELVTESYISTTVYTPFIQQTIEYDNKKINLHLAMRYNEYEDKTYFYVASPLITLSY